MDFIAHDKKVKSGYIDLIFVPEVGSYRIEKMKISDYSDYLKENLCLT
jgi:3-dehydroquinate synthetase